MYVPPSTFYPLPHGGYQTANSKQKSNWVIVLTEQAAEEHKKRMEKERVKGARKIDPARLQWKPPVFTASSRTWNW